MQNNKLGCFTGTGIFAMLVTLFVVVGVAFASGSQMFSAGDLNAQTGDDLLGGVTSHAQITECKACHTAPWEIEKMADRCVTCHTDVAIQQFDPTNLHSVIAQNSPELACHDCHPEHRGETADLTDLSGKLFPHDALGFSLNGHQLNILRKPFACADCHQGDASTFTLQICDDCHRQLDAAFMDTHTLSYGADCLACHDGVDRYGDDFSHATFGFSLDGKHTSLDCTQCHVNARSAADLQSVPTDCFSCHQKDDTHVGAFGTACGVCHSPEAWTPAKFNHDLAAFKLEGEHINVVCETCHVNNVFKGTPTTCYACHQKDDEHQGQFGTDCAFCHTSNSWDDATFDHSRSTFKLDGAHVQIRCEQCHVNNVFKGTPSACSSCHADPAVHAGQFGADCAACHTTSAWTPAAFNGQHTFPLNHGEEGAVSCVTCHPSSYKVYTCYGCHEHTESNINSKHREEGISNFENCMECHADGRESEGGEGGDD